MGIEAANPVGAEYIILEKVNGVSVSERWDCISDLDRYKIIQLIVEVEKVLACLRFPAYGSLYLRDSPPCEYSRCLTDYSLDPTQ